MKAIADFFDSVSEYSGRATSLIIFALLFVVLYEVAARKIFNAPTVWAFDLSYMLYATMFLLGGAYTLKHRQHVAIDIITTMFSKKTQAIISLVAYLVFFFPFVLVFIYVTGNFALQAWDNLETSQSPWGQPLYHFKTLMPLGFTLLLFQGISEFIKDVIIIKREGDRK
ncbi:MAG: C4-dicarboxylate ABC transporter permease [Syntrophus sp. (in: bacteria)]|nr:C4-dicarboxylate ABC transporter permease [Syntrophus sp. (in: bacteria)]